MITVIALFILCKYKHEQKFHSEIIFMDIVGVIATSIVAYHVL